ICTLSPTPPSCPGSHAKAHQPRLAAATTWAASSARIRRPADAGLAEEPLPSAAQTASRCGATALAATAAATATNRPRAKGPAGAWLPRTRGHRRPRHERPMTSAAARHGQMTYPTPERSAAATGAYPPLATHCRPPVPITPSDRTCSRPTRANPLCAALSLPFWWHGRRHTTVNLRALHYLILLFTSNPYSPLPP